MNESHTTAAVQRYLDDLAAVPGGSEAELLVRELLARAVDRLHQLCAGLLHRGYPRLTRGPLNTSAEEVLSGVVERLMKAMREVRPQTVRQFFALANQHIRWELNELARRLDEGDRAVDLRDSQLLAPAEDDGSETTAGPSPGLRRILAAIDELPPDEREVLSLVRVQGLARSEAAQLVGVSVKTIQRRLNRALVLLSERLDHRAQEPAPPAPAVDHPPH